MRLADCRRLVAAARGRPLETPLSAGHNALLVAWNAVFVGINQGFGGLHMTAGERRARYMKVLLASSTPLTTSDIKDRTGLVRSDGFIHGLLMTDARRGRVSYHGDIYPGGGDTPVSVWSRPGVACNNPGCQRCR
jgi:hypothetical protein